jgi:hypothetical protein
MIDHSGRFSAAPLVAFLNGAGEAGPRDSRTTWRTVMENVLTPHLPLTTRGARAQVWTGRVLTGLIVAFLLLDAVGKLIPLAVVVEGTQKVGYAVEVIRPLGFVLAVSTLLHVIPRTELLGAVLLTAYLGGATATHVRQGAPFWFLVVMGVVLWAAYALRSPRLRSLLHSQAR